MNKLYDDKIALLENKIKYQAEEINRLKSEIMKKPKSKGLSDEELIKKHGDKQYETFKKNMEFINIGIVLPPTK